MKESLIERLKMKGFNGSDIHWFMQKHGVSCAVVTSADMKAQKEAFEQAEIAEMFENVR